MAKTIKIAFDAGALTPQRANFLLGHIAAPVAVHRPALSHHEAAE